MINNINQPSFSGNMPRYNIPIDGLKQLIKEGKSNREIAKFYNCSPQAIVRTMKKYELSSALANKRDAKIKNVMTLFNSKVYTPKEIAKSLHLPLKLVKNIIESQKPIVPVVMEIPKDEVLEAVLKKLNMSYESIKQYLK